MGRFVGRARQLGLLERALRRVGRQREGTLLAMRGRRQVGKSRLVEEFVRRQAVPRCFYSASRGMPTAEARAALARELTASGLLADSAEVQFNRWEALFRLLARSVTEPTILVLDELPYLLEGDATFEGMLQTVWDRYLSRTPLLMVVVGSDIGSMQALSLPDRPLYQRAREMIVEPLTVAEVADLCALPAATAIDAYVVTGGFPRVAEDWEPGMSFPAFLREQFADSVAPLVVTGERILAAEFPKGLQARAVLETIGGGSTTFGTMATRTGLNQGSLLRTLKVLVQDKRVVACERPLCGRKVGNVALYHVRDAYLRFWLACVAPCAELLLRGRGDVALARVLALWPQYRGRAVEPVVRACIEALLPDDRFGDACYVGSYWTRTSDVEVDLVGGKTAQAPTAIGFVGSIKWREARPFQRADLDALVQQRDAVPGARDARLVGVCPAGFDDVALDVRLTSKDLVRASAAL